MLVFMVMPVAVLMVMAVPVAVCMIMVMVMIMIVIGFSATATVTHNRLLQHVRPRRHLSLAVTLRIIIHASARLACQAMKFPRPPFFPDEIIALTAIASYNPAHE